jgi:hypothetical protein
MIAKTKIVPPTLQSIGLGTEGKLDEIIPVNIAKMGASAISNAVKSCILLFIQTSSHHRDENSDSHYYQFIQHCRKDVSNYKDVLHREISKRKMTQVHMVDNDYLSGFIPEMFLLPRMECGKKPV